MVGSPNHSEKNFEKKSDRPRPSTNTPRCVLLERTNLGKVLGLVSDDRSARPLSVLRHPFPNLGRLRMILEQRR